MTAAERPDPMLSVAVLVASRLLQADLAEKSAREADERYRRLLTECLPHLRSTEARGLRARVVAALEREP